MFTNIFSFNIKRFDTCSQTFFFLTLKDSIHAHKHSFIEYSKTLHNQSKQSQHFSANKSLRTSNLNILTQNKLLKTNSLNILTQTNFSIVFMFTTHVWIMWKLFNIFYSNVEIMWKLFNILYYLHSILSVVSRNHYSWFHLSFFHFNEITWNQSYFLHIFRFHFCFKTINIHDVSKIFFKNRVFVKKVHFLLLSRIQQNASSSTKIWFQNSY